MKGRKQASIRVPGVRYFSSPIHERGQPSTARPLAEPLHGAGVTARLTLEVITIFPILGAMELITIPNHCHRGLVSGHARFGSHKTSIEANLRPREGAASICAGCYQPAPGHEHLRAHSPV